MSALVYRLIPYASPKVLRERARQAKRDAHRCLLDGNYNMALEHAEKAERDLRLAALSEAHERAWREAEKESDDRWAGAAWIVERARKMRGNR